MRPHAIAAALVVAGCTRRDAAPPPPPATTVPAAGHYPVGRACSDPKAIAAEKRTLPPLADWTTVTSAAQRIAVRVPPGVFTTTDGADGLVLASKEKAAGLGPDASAHVFAIRFRRLSRSVDDLLADRSKDAPLAHVYVDDAFPKRTTASFVAHPSEPLGSGDAVQTTVAGRPAWVLIGGVEGYDTDWVLVELGKQETLLVVADWNTAIMAGQPECWQRAIIGGVVDSVKP